MSQFAQTPCWSDNRWEACLAAGGGAKWRYQYCTDVSGIILYFRALQRHSGRNLIDPLLQDMVVIQRGIFHHIYHIGCAFNLHSINSIINNGLISGSQDLSRRQTVFFLPVDPMDQSRKDLDKMDLNAPRRAQYWHKAWKRSTSILILRKVWNSFRLDRTLSFITKHFQRIVFRELLGWKTGEVIYEKKFT